jgi:hypothetical protein
MSNVKRNAEIIVYVSCAECSVLVLEDAVFLERAIVHSEGANWLRESDVLDSALPAYSGAPYLLCSLNSGGLGRDEAMTLASSLAVACGGTIRVIEGSSVMKAVMLIPSDSRWSPIVR